MSAKQNPDVEDAKKMMVKTKGKEQEEEVVMAWSSMMETETETETETRRFKPKAGSVIPRKRKLVKSMMFDYFLLKLTASTPAQTSTTGETNRVYPHHSPN